MKTIEELLKNLARPEVLEFGLVTNRLPSVNIGGKFEPVDDEAPSTERLMQMLVTMGGSRYVDALTDKPVQWTTRLDGVGVIAVAAIMRKEVVQARFTVARREGREGGAANRSPAVTSTQQSAGTKPSANQPAAAAAAAAAATQQRPPAQLVRTQESRTGATPGAPTPSPQPVAAKAQQPTSQGAQPQAQPQPASTQSRAAQPATSGTNANPNPSAGMAAVKQTAQIQPQVIKNVVTGSGQGGALQQQQQQQQQQPPAARPAAGVSAAAAAAAPVAQAGAAAPAPEEEWDDDDEPTLQTLSPPVTTPPTSGGAGDPRPKPARRPEEVSASRPDLEEVNAAAIRAAQDARAAAEQRVSQERAAQERAAQERAAQERIAEQQRAAAEQRAAQERAAQERAAKERTAQEQRAAQERAARERVAAQDAQRKAAAAAAPPQGPGRRINTPTSVDAVDVEITTNDAGSGKRPVKIDIDLDADGAENTLNVPGAGDAAKAATTAATAKPATAGATPAAAAKSGVSTTTAPNIPEKDRPRVESSAALDSFLAMAVAARASDLHVIAGRPILLRVATDLLPRTQAVPAEHVERIAKEIVPTRLRETLDKEGSCDFAVEHTTHGRFRVNVSRQRTGFKIALRVVPREVGTFASLGLPEVLGNHLRHQRGLILITGPASHGKSTTLAACIDFLSREMARHIITVEEPIEHVHPRKKSLVSQREVGLHARTKSRAIQSALRQDCDTLVIGEMRDRDSMRNALIACGSGRLVLATMNMPSAAKTIDRIRDLFSPSEEPWVRSSLASSLRLIIGQRLVPSADRTRLHVAVELLPWSVALYGLIREGRTHQIATLQQRGKPLGIVRLDESLADLARAQKVTVEVAKQFAESPADLETQAVRPTGVVRKG